MLRPLAKSGLDLAGRVRTSAWASSGREPARTVGCILSRSGSQAFRGLRPRRPSIPIRFSLRPPVLKTVEGRKPGSRLTPVTILKIARYAGSESRAGPLEAGVSPDFRAAVSLGLLTFSRKPV